jgi:menaquinol-cytochrome c reductase iron-sulfur subunit
MERRQLLRWFVKGVGLTVGGVLVVPAVMTAWSPVSLRPRHEVWVTLGPLADFAENEVVKASVAIPRDDWAATPAAKSVFVLRRSAGETIVYSRNCTDLSCPLTWDPGSRWFYCPCHGGIFCEEGEPKAGPPSRPMYRYATRVREGLLEIDLNSVPPVA